MLRPANVEAGNASTRTRFQDAVPRQDQVEASAALSGGVVDQVAAVCARVAPARSKGRGRCPGRPIPARSARRAAGRPPPGLRSPRPQRSPAGTYRAGAPSRRRVARRSESRLRRGSRRSARARACRLPPRAPRESRPAHLPPARGRNHLLTSARSASCWGSIGIARASSRERSSSCSMRRRSRNRLFPKRLLELLPRLCRQRVPAVAQRRGDPVDRGRRRAQLVRRNRDEVQLQLVEPHDLLVDAGPLERERDARGDERQELLVLASEDPRRESADMEHAEHSFPHESGTPSRLLIPFSRNSGLRTSAWSTSSS